MINSFLAKGGEQKTIEGQVCYIGALCLQPFSAEFCGWVGIMTLLVPDLISLFNYMTSSHANIFR